MMVSINKEQSDCYKGLAIILVVLHHFFHAPSFLLPPKLFLGVGVVSCSIFFFLSGYGLGISGKYKAHSSYWMARMKKLFIPSLLSNGLLMVYCLFYRDYCLSGDSILDLVGLKNLNHPIWFLQVLFVFYITLWIFHKVKITYLILLLFLVSVFYLFLTGNYGGASLFSFPLGLYIAEKKSYFSPPQQVSLFLSVVWFLSLIVFSYTNCVLTVPLGFIAFVLIILLTVFPLSSLFTFIPKSTLLRYLGVNSIYVYLTHALAIYIAVDLMGYHSWFSFPVFLFVEILLFSLVKKLSILLLSLDL